MRSWLPFPNGLRRLLAKRKPAALTVRRSPLRVEQCEDRCLLSSYAILDLGAFSGGTSLGNGINGVGTTVGYSNMSSGDLHAFRNTGGGLNDLGTLGGTYANAISANDSGKIVGQSTIAGDIATHAFQYANGHMTDLGTLGGTNSQARAINAGGQIVGRSDLAGNLYNHAFLFSAGSLTDLGTLGGVNSQANAISRDGTITGGSFVASGDFHAFSYANGTMTDLGTLGGTYSEGFGINASGKIVGQSNIRNDTAQHAFLYSGGTMTDLGTLGGPNSQANGINDAGVVVGTADVNAYSTGGFIYTNGHMSSLNSLLPSGSQWDLWAATGINNAGQIVGYGISPSGFEHAFLLSPAPHVVSASPTGNVTGSVSRITITFDQAIKNGTFTLADVVSLTGPGGAITPTAVNKLSPTKYAVVFPSQSAAGTYTLTIGPNILGLAGNAMDQNGNGIAGEVPGDRFTTSFTITAGPTRLTTRSTVATATLAPSATGATQETVVKAGAVQQTSVARMTAAETEPAGVHHSRLAKERVDQLFQ